MRNKNEKTLKRHNFLLFGENKNFSQRSITKPLEKSVNFIIYIDQIKLNSDTHQLNFSVQSLIM